MNQRLLLIMALCLNSVTYPAARQAAQTIRKSVPEVLEAARAQTARNVEAARLAADQQTAAALKRPAGHIQPLKQPSGAKSLYDILGVKNPHKPSSLIARPTNLPAVAKPTPSSVVLFTEAELAIVRAQQPKTSMQQTQEGLSFLKALNQSAQPLNKLGIPSRIGQSSISTQQAAQEISYTIPRSIKPTLQQPGRVNVFSIVEPVNKKLPTPQPALQAPQANQLARLPKQPSTIAVYPPAESALALTPKTSPQLIAAGQQISLAALTDIAQAQPVRECIEAMKILLQEQGVTKTITILIDPAKQLIGFIAGDVKAVMDRATSKALFTLLQNHLKSPVIIEAVQQQHGALTFKPSQQSLQALQKEFRPLQIQQAEIAAQDLFALEAVEAALADTPRPTYVKPTSHTIPQPTVQQPTTLKSPAYIKPTRTPSTPAQPKATLERPLYQRPTIEPIRAPQATTPKPTVAPTAPAESWLSRAIDTVKKAVQTTAQKIKNFFSKNSATTPAPVPTPSILTRAPRATTIPRIAPTLAEQATATSRWQRLRGSLATIPSYLRGLFTRKPALTIAAPLVIPAALPQTLPANKKFVAQPKKKFPKGLFADTATSPDTVTPPATLPTPTPDVSVPTPAPTSTPRSPDATTPTKTKKPQKAESATTQTKNFRPQAKSSQTTSPKPLTGGGADKEQETNNPASAPQPQQTSSQAQVQPSRFIDQTSSAYKPLERMPSYASIVNNRPPLSSAGLYGGESRDISPETTKTVKKVRSGSTVIATPKTAISTRRTYQSPAISTPTAITPTSSYHKETINRAPYKLTPVQASPADRKTVAPTPTEPKGWFSSVIDRVKKFFGWISGS